MKLLRVTAKVHWLSSSRCVNKRLAQSLTPWHYRLKNSRMFWLLKLLLKLINHVYVICSTVNQILHILLLNSIFFLAKLIFTLISHVLQILLSNHGSARHSLRTSLNAIIYPKITFVRSLWLRSLVRWAIKLTKLRLELLLSIWCSHHSLLLFAHFH